MKTIYTISEDKKTLIAERSFTTSLESLWSAWTEHSKLDTWWAPKPWQAHTKSFNFTEGGSWHYCMEGPEGEKHWGKTTYLLIVPLASYTALDSFCDEVGEINKELPASHYEVQFDEEGELTKLFITTTYATPEDLENVLGMGMQAGFNQALDQLEEVLKQEKTQ